ncbi:MULTISPECIES: TonB-dependent siderophore receptor [unclassified Caulobacter]|uniref:TonB-dependent receptor plug domain-containing protein n=1 Tax=unclassified Caulobacter TaxID=2648921 RepID=UPI001304FFD3|nr:MULTISPECIES: TonB-dependent receptor [unclassified Caulobacter]
MLDRKLLLASSVIAGLGLAPVGAWAQTQTQNKTKAAAPAPAEDEVEAVVVTGSRLKQNAYNSASPIQVITSDQASLEGLIDTTAIIQGSSIASGSFQVGNELTGYNITGGPGVNSISLRGLGANRTLVLLDGHRIAPSGVRGQVGPTDLNTIPNAVVERVEILKDGASSIYGSDAVAGVVNYITKKDFDGGKIKLYGNAPFSSGGGGNQYTAEALWGKTFSRGYVNVTGSYYKQNALRRGDREYTSCASENYYNLQTGARLDYTDPVTGGLKCYNQLNNVISTSVGYLQYKQDGLDYSYAGNNSTFAGLARVARANYAESYRYANYDSAAWQRATVISPVERYSLYVKGGYDISDSVEAYGEVLYNRRNSEQDGARQLYATLASTNPNNTLGAAAGTVQPVISVAYDSIQKVDYYHGLGGIRGDLRSLSDTKLDFLKSWSWDVYAQYGKSDGTYSVSTINADAVAATMAAGSTNYCVQSMVTISGGDCSTLPNGIPWLSQRVLSGNFTAAEKAFLFGVDVGHTVYEQWMGEASATGDLFTLPAGTVSAAVGVSFRKDDFDDTPGVASLKNNNLNLTQAGHTAGHDATTEAFIEIEAPLLRDLPFVHSLDLTVSGRHTEVDSYGDNDVYKIGLNWRITPSWRLRLSDGTSFRAPSLYELYLANQSGYTTADPCILWGSSGVSATIQANCAAQGVSSSQTTYTSLVYTGGGSGNLKAETSESKIAGIVWTPQFINLQVAVDYSEIDIDNEITQFGAANIAERCYESVNLTSAFCSLVSRDASTNRLIVHNNYVNVAEQKNRALDLNVDYRHHFPAGDLSFHSEFTWQLQDTTKLFGDSDEDDYNGSTYIYDGPDFSGRMNLSFRHEDWTINWTTSITGKGSDAELAGDTVASSKYASSTNYDYVSGGVYYKYVGRKYHTEFMAYHDVSFRKTIDDKTTLTFGVQNVFDEAPPSISSSYRVGNSEVWGYDLKGRKGFVSVERSW